MPGGRGHIFQGVGMSAERRNLPAVIDAPKKAPVAPRDYADAGGLISYGACIPCNFRRSATYIDKILKGEKAADLPVQRPATFELVVNLETAKTLDISIPRSILARADEVLE